MIAHGVTFVGWMLEYESIAPTGDKTEIWNEAVDRSQRAETRVVETTYRLLRVHEDDEPCPICPPQGAPAEGKAPVEQPGAAPVVFAGPLADEKPATGVFPSDPDPDSSTEAPKE